MKWLSLALSLSLSLLKAYTLMPNCFYLFKSYSLVLILLIVLVNFYTSIVITKCSIFQSSCTSSAFVLLSSSLQGEGHCTFSLWPQLFFPQDVQVIHPLMRAMLDHVQDHHHHWDIQISFPRVTVCLFLHDKDTNPSEPVVACEGWDHRFAGGSRGNSRHTWSLWGTIPMWI